MITLFIDTSSINVYIAIVSGDKVLASKEACIPSGHSKYTTSFIKNCLDEAGIDANDINNILLFVLLITIYFLFLMHMTAQWETRTPSVQNGLKNAPSTLPSEKGRAMEICKRCGMNPQPHTAIPNTPQSPTTSYPHYCQKGS